MSIVVADTSFLVDFERRRANAMNWITSNPEMAVAPTPFTLAEFRIGDTGSISITDLFESAPRLALRYSAAEMFAHVARVLRAAGKMIGTNDLWIASMALDYGLPVLTRNVAEFSRVPGLSLAAY